MSKVTTTTVITTTITLDEEESPRLHNFLSGFSLNDLYKIYPDPVEAEKIYQLLYSIWCDMDKITYATRQG